MDNNLLFGVVALQSQLIDMWQFVKACGLWARSETTSLADVLVTQGWLNEEDRAHVHYLLRRRAAPENRQLAQESTVTPADLAVVLRGNDGHAVAESFRDGRAGSERERVPSSATLQLREKLSLKSLYSTGGIGEVWIAHDKVMGRDVALKELKSTMAESDRHRERFFREAQLTGQLEHPGIVPVYDYNDDPQSGRCYYTMRFVNGRTLTEAVQAYHECRKSTSNTSATGEFIRLLSAFASICHTVAFAHSRNVIHRDLKGANVVLGDFGEVIVLDWGLAKRLDEAPSELEQSSEPAQTIVFSSQSTSSTMQGEKLGTPAYMAPEQALGQVDRIDKRTDVYGLAAILYEIMTGEPPFAGKSVVEVLDRVIHDSPVRPTVLVADVPVELEAICLRGLSKQQDDRQQSASEMAEQIVDWISARAERKRTEQERERFFNLSLDLLAILDVGGALTLTNPAWHSVLGWTDADLKGRTVWQLLHPSEHSKLKAELERIVAGEPVTAVEHRCQCKDGSYRWVLWNACLIDHDSAIYIVGRDITDRKQSEQTFQELLESAPDGMVIVNESGLIVLVNKQLERMFGYSRSDLLGRRIELLVPEEHRANHPAHVAQFMAAPDFRPMASALKLHGRCKDGRVLPVEISLSPVRTEQGLLVSCAVRDMSIRPGAQERARTAGDNALDKVPNTNP